MKQKITFSLPKHLLRYVSSSKKGRAVKPIPIAIDGRSELFSRQLVKVNSKSCREGEGKGFPAVKANEKSKVKTLKAVLVLRINTFSHLRESAMRVHVDPSVFGGSYII